MLDFLLTRSQSMFTATQRDYLDFLKMIDQRDVLEITKRRYWFMLKNLRDHVMNLSSVDDLEHLVQLKLPPEPLVKFTERQNPVRVLSTFYTENDIARILAHARNVSFKYYLILGLTAFSGDRISEVVTIKSAYLDIENRWFISGTVEGFRKTGTVLGFFPRFFQPVVRVYVQQINATTPGTQFIFPPDHEHVKHGERRGFVHPNQVRKFLYSTFNFIGLNRSGISTKGFRDAINTYRKERFGTSYEDRCRLLNHKIAGVNVRNYLKRLDDIIELRNLYDRNFPFDPHLF